MTRADMLMRAVALALALVATAAPLSAQTTVVDSAANLRYPVTGDVPDLCLIALPTLASGAPAINIRSTTGNVVAIEALTDDRTLSTNASDVTLAFAAVCNYPYRVTVTSANNGLWRQSADTATPVGFANAVPYLAEMGWDENTARLDADARSRQPKQAGFASDLPSASTLTLRLRVLPGTTNTTAGAPLIAGDYRDTISITVGPQ